MGGSEAVEPVVAVLTDSHWLVRYHAARALGNIGDSRAVEPLQAALKDEKEDVRRTAAEALKKIKAAQEQK